MNSRPAVTNEPMLVPAAGLAAGVMLERLAAFTLFESVAAAAGFTLLALFPSRTPLRKTCIGLAAAAAGIAVALWHAPAPPPEIDASALETVIVSGCVVEPSVFSENREQFTLELDPGARARVSLNLREGQAPPRLRYGQIVELEGRVRRPHNFGNPGSFDYETYLARRQVFWNLSTRTGTEVTVLPGACGSAIEKWLFGLRAEALDRLELLYAGDEYKSILTQAVLLGENTRLEKSWTEHFRRTGTYHALVISGLHLTVLAGWLLLMLRYTTGKVWLSLLLSFAAAWVYALACGMSAPIGRAAGGFTLFLVSRFWHRPTHLLNALSVVVIVFLLFEPAQLFDGSFQLSVLSVLAIAALVTPLFEWQTRPIVDGFAHLEEVHGDPAQPFAVAALRVEARLLADTIALYTRIPKPWCTRAVSLLIRVAVHLYEICMLSAVVQVALALPMAYFFHRVSISGLLANVFIVPVMNAVVVLGFVAVLLHARWIAAIAGWLLDLARRIAEFFSSLEPGWRIPDPPLWLGLAFTASLVTLSLIARRRTLWRWAAFAAVMALFALLVAHPFEPQLEHGRLEVTALDVGQGDSVFIVTPQGQTLLVDAGGVPWFKGRPKPRLDIGEDVVSSYLWTRSIRRLDVLVLTHAHEDHSGGIASLMANFRPRELWVGAMGESEVWKRVREAARIYGVRIVPRKADESISLGGAEFSIVAPLADYEPTDTARNNDSLVMAVRYGRRSILLTGDMEKEVERTLAAEGFLPHVDILKAGHHGSRSSSTPEFLEATRPQFAIVSAGLENLYRHPHPDVLARMAERGIRVLRTDRHGQLRILTDGNHLEILPYRR
jgi:competence protein ComEC